VAIQIGSMYFSVGADTRDYQSKMAQVDATARNVAGSASSSLRRIAETATGFLVAQAIPAVINGFKGLAQEAFNAYGNYERLSLSLETLARRDLMEAATLEKTLVVGQRRVELSAQEIEKLGDLMRQRDLYAAQLQEEAERHRQLVERWGEEGLAVQTHAARMAQLQDRYEDTAQAIANLEGKQGQYVDIVQRSTEVVLDEAEAKRRSAEIAQELLHWQQQLNINSPFDEEGVQQAMRTAAAYGFVTEQALAAAVETGKLTQEQVDAEISLQRLVQATTDYAAGTGRTTKEVELISLALGQVKAKGKLAGQEILQLTNAGVNVRKILADAFNVTTQELVKMQEQGLIPADKAIKAIVESFEKDFGGAAKEQTRTWQGLTSTLSDLKKIGLREFFTGTFQAIQPYVADFVDKLASPETLQRLREIGDAIGEKVGGALERVQKIALSFQMGGVPGLLMALGVDFETVKTLQTIGDLIEGVFSRIQRAFQEGGLSGAIAQARDEFGKFVPGILADLRGKADEWGQQVREWVGQLWANVKDWWATGGGELVTGTIERIGQWLADVIRGFGQFSENARGGLLETIGKLWRGLVDWWNDGGGEIVLGTLEALGRALAEIGAALWDVMQGLAAEIARYTRDLWYGLVDWWQTGGQQMTADALAAIGQWLSQLLSQLLADLPTWASQIATWIEGLFAQIIDAIAQRYPGWADKGGALLGEFLGKALDFLFNQLPVLVGKLVAWLSGLFGGEGDGESNQVIAAAARLGDAVWAGVQLGLQSFWEALYENAPEQVQRLMDWIEGVIYTAKETIKWLEELPEKGKDLITGLLSGISAKAGETLTTVSRFVADNVRGAVNWIEFLWQVGRDLVEGLRRGIESKVEEFKNWIVGWAKRVIPQPLWSFFGIHSPSLLMMELGEMLVAGLLSGIQGSTPEAVKQVSDAASSILNAFTAAIRAFTALSEYQLVDLDAKIAGVIRQLSSLMYAMGQFWEAENAERAAMLGEWIGKAVAPLKALIDVLDALAGYRMVDLHGQIVHLVEQLSALMWAMGQFREMANAEQAAELGQWVVKAIAPLKTMVEAFTALAAYKPVPLHGLIVHIVEQLSALMWAMGQFREMANAEQAAELGQWVVKAIAPLKAMVEAFTALAKFKPVPLHGLIVHIVEQLSALMWAMGQFREMENAERAAQLGEWVGKAIAPIKTAIDAFTALARYRTRGIAAQAIALIDEIGSLVDALVGLSQRVGMERLALVAEIGATIVDALAPWQAVVETITSIVDVAGVRIEDAATRLIWMTHGLVVWMHWLIDYLPSGLLDAVADTAQQVVAALSPWKAAGDAISAIVEVSGVRIESASQRLIWMTHGLVEWMRWLQTYLPTGLLEDTAEYADAVTRALAPWSAAAEAVRAIAEVAGTRIESAAQRLIWMTHGLVKWMHWLIDYLPVGMLEQVSAKADMVVRALAPWRAVADAVKAIDDAAGARVLTHEQPAARLMWLTYSLVQWTNWLIEYLPWGVLEQVAAKAEMIVRALSPWRAVADAVKAIDDAAGAGVISHGGRGAKLMWLTYTLIDWTRWLLDYLPVGVLERVAAQAEVLIRALSPWRAIVDAVAALNTRIETAGIPEKAGLLADVAGALILALESVVDRIGRETLEKAALVGKKLSDVLAPWDKAIKLADAMRAWKLMPDLVDRFSKFARQWVEIVADLAKAVAVLSEDGLDMAQRFGEVLGSLVDGLAGALELALALPETWAIPASWGPFVAWVKAVFLDFYAWVTGWTSGTRPPAPDFDGEQMDLVALVADTIGSLMNGLRAALDLALALPETWSVNQGAWDTFVAWVRGVFMEFYQWVNTDLLAAIPTEPGDEPGDPTTSMGLVQTFGSALSGLMGGLSSALQLALGFPEAASFPAGEVWDNFKGWVMLVFAEFQTWVVETFHPEDPDEFGPVASFGQAMQAVFGGLVSALEFFQGIVGWVGMGSTFQERLTLFLDEVKARFVEIATFVETELDADVMATVGLFGEKLGDLADGLSSALDFFAQVADTDPAAYTSSHEFKVRVQALIRTIHETIAAFNEYVVQENGDLWVPVADRLFDAFERMVGLMQDALNLFVDLQASNLPTPNDLQTFIALVIQLFQNLTGAILGAGTGAQSGVGQVQSAVQGGLAILAGYADDFFDLGYNFAVALADGIAAGIGAVANAATALGDAAAGATGDALQISSPSRVAMGLGEMFVGGFVNALLSGQREVDAAMRGLVGPQLAPAGLQVDARRHLVVEFRGQAGGGVPLPHSQFDALKRELIWELQRGA